MFITVDSKPLITAGFGPSASKVVGNKNGHHHRLDITIGSCYKLAVIRIFKNSKIRSKIVKKCFNPKKRENTWVARWWDLNLRHVSTHVATLTTSLLSNKSIYPIKTNPTKLIILHLLAPRHHPLLLLPHAIKCPLTNGFSSGCSYLHMTMHAYR
jgi:hypothetical protein